MAGDHYLINALVQLARTYIYTTALPPAVIGTSLAAVKVIRSESWRREKLHTNVQYFRQLANRVGLRIGNSSTPIQPILTGSSENAIRVSHELKESGIWVVAIRPPTVPVGSARLRVTLTAEHEHADIQKLVECLTGFEVHSMIGEAVQ